MKPPTTDKYINGKIYSLISSDNYYYIGSTASELNLRLSNHKYLSKKYPNRYVYKHINTVGWNNVKIELIEEYPCNSKKELNEREDYFIKQAKDMNDTFCLNLNRAYVSKNERKENVKEYYENNKENILEYAKQYRDDNKEKIKDYKDFYNIIKADTRSEYNKIYVKKNEEKVKGNRKKYYEENKDIILEKHKEYIQKNKELVAQRKKTYKRTI